MQRSHVQLEVGSPKRPYSWSPEMLSRISICLPRGTEKHLPREEVLVPRAGSASSLEEAFGGIYLVPNDSLLSKPFSCLETDQLPQQS